MDVKCAGTTKAGKPCRGTPLPGREWCFVHDPALAERRHQASVKGGLGKSAKVRAQKQLRDAVMDLDDVAGLLSLSMRKVATGTMEPSVGTALGAMARALITVRESGEVTQQIAELQEAIAAINGQDTGMRRIA